MPATVITVRGSFDSFFPPERATLALSVGFQGADQGEVCRRTQQATDSLTAALRAISNPGEGPVTWWSSARLRTWAEKPWNKDGKQLPLVHHASVGATAKFRDFEALAHFVGQASSMPGLTIGGLSWTLTEARKAEVEREARRRAVADAVARATDYAAELGLTDVVAVAVADVGMLGDQTDYRGGGQSVKFGRALAASASAGGTAASPGVDLNPEDVAVSATVDARFHAS